MTEDGDVRAIGALLEDEYAHTILIQTSKQEMSAQELSEACDASVSTVYRRIERLQEYELLEERLQLDKDGHHYNTYTARLKRIEVELENGEFAVDLTYREPNAADRFTDLFEGMR